MGHRFQEPNSSVPAFCLSRLSSYQVYCLGVFDSPKQKLERTNQMVEQTLMMESKETAYLLAQQHAIIRLISMTMTFLFWFSISILIIVREGHRVISFGPLSKLNQFLSIFGLSPLLLTLLTWRGIDRICSLYIKKYISSHLRSSP